MATRKLTDILGGGGGNFRDRWNDTTAAGDFEPLPAGEYVAKIIAGELESSRSKSTPGYRLTFVVIEGEHKGRRFWHDVWLTEAALPMAKRDLSKLGVTDPQQLEQPLPAVFVCRVKLIVRTDDDRTERNRVRSFEVIRVEPLEADPFRPDTGDGEGVAA